MSTYQAPPASVVLDPPLYQVGLEILILAWVFVFIHFVNVKAAKALMRLRPCQNASEHSLKEYAICTPIFVQGRGAVSALARLNAYCKSCLCIDGKNLPYTYLFVHVREQWRLWQECMHTKACLRIHWKKMPLVHPFCTRARTVNALARLNAF